MEDSHDDLAAVVWSAITSAMKVMGTLKTYGKGEH